MLADSNFEINLAAAAFLIFIKNHSEQKPHLDCRQASPTGIQLNQGGKQAPYPQIARTEEQQRQPISFQLGQASNVTTKFRLYITHDALYIKNIIYIYILIQRNCERTRTCHICVCVCVCVRVSMCACVCACAVLQTEVGCDGWWGAA